MTKVYDQFCYDFKLMEVIAKLDFFSSGKNLIFNTLFSTSEIRKTPGTLKAK